VRALRTTRILSSRNLPVRLGCDSACTLTATASIAPRSTSRRRRPVAVSVKVDADIPAGESRLVRFELGQRDVRRLRRALRGRRGLYADLSITATAAAGEPTEVSQRLRLTG
jgi:hypothetical protein